MSLQKKSLRKGFSLDSLLSAREDQMDEAQTIPVSGARHPLGLNLLFHLFETGKAEGLPIESPRSGFHGHLSANLTGKAL
mgnify:CR=1 FL=1